MHHGPRRRRAAETDHPTRERVEIVAPDGDVARSGRHTVPDELVQAATYLLPPDRVFRATVRHTGPPSGPGEDPPNRHVPKPRQS